MAVADPLAIRLPGYVTRVRPVIHPAQHAFLALSVPEAFYGGAGGGGKSDSLLMAALQYVDVPAYTAILFRKTYADLERAGALMDRAKAWLSGTDAAWSAQRKRWTFPSGARIEFGYLQHSKDRENYRSAEYQYVGFDELTQFDEADYRFLFSRMRKPSSGPLAAVPLRMRGASNPGGPGHVWVRDRFIKKIRSDLDDEMELDPRTRVFVPARLADNPSVDQASYTAQLMHLDPQTRRQILDGDWDAREPGACFTEFVWSEHTVEGTRHPESRAEVVKAIDFGLHHAPCLWIEVAGNSAFVFAEHDEREGDTHKLAESICSVDREFGTGDSEAFIDPAGLGTNYQTGQTDADVLRAYGIAVANLDNSDRYGREQRTSMIKYLLRNRRLFISRSECPYLIEALERAVWDRWPNGHPKDCYRKDGLWEHPLDALGEALVRIFRPFAPAAAETSGSPYGSGAEFSHSPYG